VSHSEACDTRVFGAVMSAPGSPWSSPDLHLPDDLPSESDVVEQRDKERHADEDVRGVGVGLHKRRTDGQLDVGMKTAERLTVRRGTVRWRRWHRRASTPSYRSSKGRETL
jgi:hypothetical protein